MAISKRRGKVTIRPGRIDALRVPSAGMAQRPFSRCHGSALAAESDPAEFGYPDAAHRTNRHRRSCSRTRDHQNDVDVPTRHRWTSPRFHFGNIRRFFGLAWASSTVVSSSTEVVSGRVRMPPAAHIGCVTCPCRRWELVGVDGARGGLRVARLAPIRPAACDCENASIDAIAAGRSGGFALPAVDASLLLSFARICALARRIVRAETSACSACFLFVDGLPERRPSDRLPAPPHRGPAAGGTATPARCAVPASSRHRGC